jgi:hypothetical protein
METPRPYTPADKARLILAVLFMAMILLVPAVVVPALLLGSFSFPGTSAGVAQAAENPTTHVAVDIMPVKPGGPAQNWPAYIASTSMTVPANTVITVTIRNFDLGDAALAADNPLRKVQGTIGGTASVDGQPYRALDPTKVAHTFTVPTLGINVPIPGDAPHNDSYLTVTFSFRTGKAGTYVFQCFAPCGTGNTGFDGPMASMAFMKGTLTVQG